MIAVLRRRWPLYAVLALVAGVGLFALLGYLVAPGLLRDLAQDRLARELARPVRVERVEVRPFALAATIHGVSVDHADGRALLTVDAVVADVSSASLWHRAPVVDRLRIVHPRLTFARLDAARYDISDLIDRWLAPSDEPLRYSLNNVEIVGGAIAFDDRPMRRTHHVETLEIGVPFLSSLPYHTEIDVQPKLAASIGGTHVALAGHAKPYAPTPEATLAIDVDALPLPAYVDYLPAKLTAKVAAGKLSSHLDVTFAQPRNAPPTVVVTGSATLAGLDVQRRDGTPLVAAREMRVALDRLDVSARAMRVASVAIDEPQASVRRLRDGSLELAGPWIEASASAAPSVKSAATQPWRVEVAALAVRNGRARIEDASISPAYAAEVTQLVANATTLANTAERSGKLDATLRIDGDATVSLQADLALAPFAAAGRFEVANARLARVYPYAAEALDLVVQRGSGDYASAFELTAQGNVRLTGGKAAVRDVALAAPGEREPLWRMPEAAAEGIDVDAGKRSVTIASLQARAPQIVVERDARGDWNFARLLRAAPSGTVAKPEDGAWTARVAKATAERGALRLIDATFAPPLTVRHDEIALTLTELGNARGVKTGVDLRARVERVGRVAAKGSFANPPFQLTLDLTADRLPLLPAKPLIERHANVILTSGAGSARGRLDVTPGAPGPPRFAWRGDVALHDVEALDPPTGGRLVACKSLALTQLVARSEPFEASVAAVSLADFYARLIVYADGTLNLAKLARDGGDTPVTKPAPATAKGGAVASAAHTAERTLRRAVDGSLPFAVGRIALANGNVQFSDYFVRPNYSANLTQLGGSVSTLSPTQAGEVTIEAKLDDAAPVSITGRIQPFARDLSLALAGKARDIELAPLSPYSAKYAGYGITKGKLAFDVDYTIDNRKLDAKNRLVLDQLTFGERVDSPDATKLPVLLAVALLKDVNGVIDIDLPIGGTLDDPQFSVWGLIVRVVVNLLTKAAMAPFALLGAIAGGGEELAWVEYAAGAATLDAAANDRLDKLAKALGNRPGLKVDVAGRTEPASDTEALARAAVERVLRGAKMKSLAGKAEAPPAVDTVAMTAEERPKWLAAAYRELPAEARKRDPAAKGDVTAGEMEAALAKQHRPDDAALVELGMQRARAAKDALVVRGVSAERVFIVAAKPADAAAKGSPRRADFALK